jgi:hypothetical protein
MPQLDIFTYNIQCFWLTIFFFYSFYHFYNLILIQLFKAFKIRNFISMYVNKANYDVRSLFDFYNDNLMGYNNFIILNILNKNISNITLLKINKYDYIYR